AGWCRTRVNKQVGRLKRVFRWAVGQELLPVAVAQSLACVQGLQKGRTDARETEPVVPVADVHLAATLPHLTPTVRAMVELQRLAGLRPGEVRELQPADLEMTGAVWVYGPAQHKMSHLGREKAVPIGQRARSILEPLVKGRRADEYLFSPARSREEMFAMRRTRRKSKVPPSQMNRRKPVADLLKKPGTHFTSFGYAAVIRPACIRAGVPQWHPNQIRHTFATEVRRVYGLEAAQVLLGHAKADVTQVYAERDWELAMKVAAEIG